VRNAIGKPRSGEMLVNPGEDGELRDGENEKGREAVIASMEPGI